MPDPFLFANHAITRTTARVWTLPSSASLTPSGIVHAASWAMDNSVSKRVAYTL